MKKEIIILALFIALPLVVAQQIPWAVSDLRCGNGVLDKYELCEKNVTTSYCKDVGTILKIATACDEKHCTCLPRVNKVYCGNNHREGVEMCDGTGPDMCPQLGKVMNLSLVCDPATCGCKINETLPPDYNPLVIEELKNESEHPSICGNKKVERAEDCDPPNTLCTTNTKEPGICTEKCKCVPPEALATPEKPQENATNATNETTTTPAENKTIAPQNATPLPEAPPQEEHKGFFSRFIDWIIGLFS